MQHLQTLIKFLIQYNSKNRIILFDVFVFDVIKINNSRIQNKYSEMTMRKLGYMIIYDMKELRKISIWHRRRRKHGRKINYKY